MGLRRSEIIGVKYSDIDYINRTLSVEHLNIWKLWKMGAVSFELRYGKYTVAEFEAPEGYEVNDEKYEFTITEDGQVVSVIMTNKAIPKETPEEPDEPKKDTPTEMPKTPTSTEGPKTGDDADVALWMVLAGVAAVTGVGLTVFSVKRKKKDKEK